MSGRRLPASWVGRNDGAGCSQAEVGCTGKTLLVGRAGSSMGWPAVPAMPTRLCRESLSIVGIQEDWEVDLLSNSWEGNSHVVGRLKRILNFFFFGTRA
jgi:hypothetical protein